MIKLTISDCFTLFVPPIKVFVNLPFTWYLWFEIWIKSLCLVKTIEWVMLKLTIPYFCTLFAPQITIVVPLPFIAIYSCLQVFPSAASFSIGKVAQAQPLHRALWGFYSRAFLSVWVWRVCLGINRQLFGFFLHSLLLYCVGPRAPEAVMCFGGPSSRSH